MCNCRLFTLVQSLFLIGSGLFWLFIFPVVFNEILISKLIIKPGTIAYEAWKKPNLPTKIKIYLFSVKNPVEVENGEKPDLEEVGPFTYREELERVDEVFHTNGSVSFRTKKNWFLLPEESLSTNTMVTSVNVPILAAAEFARGNWMQEFAIGGMLRSRTSLFINVTAREILFDGYTDFLLTTGSFFAKAGDIPMDKFGWFYGRNGTTWSDGEILMDTGINDINTLGDIKLWNGKNKTIYSDHCGHVKGTAAGFLHPDPDRKYIDFFSTDICRPIRFDREEEEVSVLGVDSIKYSLIPRNTFGDAETSPDNICYNDANRNLPYGVHNATGCKGGGDTTLKTFVSLPHFHGADPFFIDQFKQGSFNSSSSKHSASITVQESTSIPTEVLMRLQIILQLSPNPNLGSFFTNLTPVLLPVLWFDAEASITDEIADQLKIVGIMPTVAEILGVCSFLTGLGLMGLFIFKTYSNRKQMETEQIKENIQDKPREAISSFINNDPKVLIKDTSETIK